MFVCRRCDDGGLWRLRRIVAGIERERHQTLVVSDQVASESEWGILPGCDAAISRFGWTMMETATIEAQRCKQQRRAEVIGKMLALMQDEGSEVVVGWLQIRTVRCGVRGG